MKKKRNNPIIFLLLLTMFACNFIVKNEVKGQKNEYIKRSARDINCDSITTWFNEKAFINRINVLNEIGIRDSFVVFSDTNSKKIVLREEGEIYEINRTEILIERIVWVIYYTDKLKELVFIGIHPDDPRDIVYISNDQKTKKILCKIVEDSSFVLNELKFTEPIPIQFIPPPLPEELGNE